MEQWSVEFLPKAENDLAKLDRAVRRRIIEKVEWLRANIDTVFPIPLTGEFKDFYKLRVGDWRVMYKIEWRSSKILVSYIGRRDRVYKKRRL